MALARTDVGVFTNASSPHGTAAFTTTSFTPPANSLLLVGVALMEDGGGTPQGNEDIGVPTISGGGLTYTRETALDGTGLPWYSTKLVVFRAPVGGSPASMTITVDDDTNQAIYGYAVSVIAFTGYDTTTPTAGQIGTGSTDIGDGAHTVTLTAAPTTADVTLFWLGLDAENNPANSTMAAGWTKVHDDGGPGGSSVIVAARREASTSTTVSVTDVYTAAGSIFKGSMSALIVKAAAGSSPQGVTPSGIATAETFGSPTLAPGAVTVAPNGVASSEVFGSATMQPGPVSIQPTGVDSAAVFGSPSVSVGGAPLFPVGIGSAEAFGSPLLSPGPVSVAPSGIGSAEAVGSPTVAAGEATISTTGILSAETFGSTTVSTGPVTVTPVGIGSSVAFGFPAVSGGEPQPEVHVRLPYHPVVPEVPTRT